MANDPQALPNATKPRSRIPGWIPGDSPWSRSTRARTVHREAHPIRGILDTSGGGFKDGARRPPHGRSDPGHWSRHIGVLLPVRTPRVVGGVVEANDPTVDVDRRALGVRPLGPRFGTARTASTTRAATCPWSVAAATTSPEWIELLSGSTPTRKSGNESPFGSPSCAGSGRAFTEERSRSPESNSVPEFPSPRSQID